jgi:uncharacterized damage-inducible protein DinB
MDPYQLGDRWAEVRRDLLATIDKFGDEDLTFRPFDGAWPAGQVMLHIAECEDYWLHRLVRRRIASDPDYPLDRHANRGAIHGILAAARGRTCALLAELDETSLSQIVTTTEGEAFSIAQIVWHVLEHEIHHRGELSLMLGLLGRQGLEV